MKCDSLTRCSAATGLRRPNLIQWDSHMESTLNELDSTENALPSDRTLCQWIKLQRVAEDAGQRIDRDAIFIIGISDPSIQNALKDFEYKMENWARSKPKQVISCKLSTGWSIVTGLFLWCYYDSGKTGLTFAAVLLALELNYIKLSTYDFTMNLAHDCSNSGVIHPQAGLQGSGKTYSEPLTPAHRAALGVCVGSIHGVLGSFLAFTPEEIRTVPTWVFARVAYASILLIEMHLTISSLESELGTLVSGGEMDVGSYISNLVNLLRAGAADGKSRPAHNFSLVMAMLQVWHEKQVNDRARSGSAAVKGEPEQKLQNGEAEGAQTTSAQQEHHQQAHGPSTLGQTPLHLLSEVAMGNSGSGNHPVANGGDGTYDPSSLPANPTNVSKADFYPPSMVGDGLRRMHPGFEQALGMTLAGGDLNIMEDDGFFDLMQRTSNMFETNGG